MTAVARPEAPLADASARIEAAARRIAAQLPPLTPQAAMKIAALTRPREQQQGIGDDAA